MTENQLEQEALGWLAELGYTHLYGSDSARLISGQLRLPQAEQAAAETLA